MSDDMELSGSIPEGDSEIRISAEVTDVITDTLKRLRLPVQLALLQYLTDKTENRIRTVNEDIKLIDGLEVWLNSKKNKA